MGKNYTKKPIPTYDACVTALQSPNKYNIFIKSDLTDLTPISIGESWPPANYISRIHTRDCTSLYYILSGCGTLSINGQEYPVQGGDLFIVPHGAKASLTTRSEYLPHRWLGFIGTLASDFERFPRPFKLPSQILDQLWFPDKEGRNLSSRLAHDLFLIHGFMHEPTRTEPAQFEPSYVQRVMNYINTFYMKKISVAQLAKEFGVSHSHLSRVFAREVNMSIMDYILETRISKAKRYLMHNYSVTDTARLCGFPDRSNFSKTFHRIVGCTPTDWVKDLDDEDWMRPR